MKTVLVYVLSQCPFCIATESLFKDLGVAYDKIVVDNRPDLWDEMVKKSGGQTAPQIFVGDLCIGGYSEMKAMHDTGALETLLQDECPPK